MRLKFCTARSSLLTDLLPILMTMCIPAADMDPDRKIMAVLAAAAARVLWPERIREAGSPKRGRKKSVAGCRTRSICWSSAWNRVWVSIRRFFRFPRNSTTRIPRSVKSSALVNLELKAGKRRTEALRNLAERTNVDELKKLVAVLIQADRFGTGIAQSLRGHADFMRVQARQVAEEKAAKLGVKLVFPIFFCILPSLFVVTVGPVAVKIVRELIPMMQNI